MARRHPHSISSDQPTRRGAGQPLVFTLRRSTLAVQAALFVGLGAAVLTAVAPSSAYAQMAPDAKRSYAVSAGPLSRVLAEFASAAGVELVVDGDLLKGKNSNGLGGSYTVDEGFAQLLQGQGLNIVRHGNGSYTLSKQAETTVAGTALPVVTVTGAAPSLVTEGTGRYTTGKSASATGLALKARETPQTVSVMTRQQLDDMGVQSIQEILHNAPGMTVSQLDSERFTFYSRGFAIDHFQYDGVPTQFTTQYGAGESEVDSILYDRVEIVRGATGLLTGAGVPSASINLVRKHANSKVFTGTLAASVASWDNYRVSADLSAPLSEDGHIRGRVVAADEQKRSYINGYSRERQTFYGVIDADLTPDTSLSVGASYARGRAKGVTYGGFPLVYSNGTSIDWRNLGRSFSIWPEWSSENTDSTNVFGQLEHEWSNGWKTSLLAMYSKQKVDNTRLFLWGFPDATTGLLNSNPSRVKFPGARDQSSIDIKNSGPFQAFGRTHEAVIGVSYSKQVADFDRVGASDAVPAVSIFNWANYPEPTSWGASVKSETYDRRQTGVYGALRLSLADPLKLIVGGRYNRWQRSGAGYMGRSPYDMTQTKVTPYAGLVLDLGDNYSLYGSYTSIYNPQNYRNRSGEFLDPIKGHNLETGIKGEFLDGRVQAAVAVFQIKQDNVAQADAGYLVPGTTTQAYVGAQGVTSKGVEFEVNGELASGWNLAFNAAHFKSTDATGADVNTASARTTAHLFTTYRLPGEWQKLTVGGGANWQSKTSNVTGVYQANNPNGVGTYGQGGYLLANFMARYQFTPQTSLQFNIDNLFDKWYYTSIDFGEQLMWGAPRSYRATLTYQF